MAYDEELAGRVREVLSPRSNAAEKMMFGSNCFLVGGNLAVCVRQGELLVRLGQEDAERAVSEDGVRVAEIRSGRQMKDWVFVSAETVAGDAGLTEWVEAGAGYAGSLPPK